VVAHEARARGVPVPPRSLTRTGGWYDLAIAVDGDSQFEYHIARHLENGEDGISDPIMGGLA
jgi:hypothetical protein